MGIRAVSPTVNSHAALRMDRGMFQNKNSKKGSKACGVSTNVPCAVEEDIIESGVTSVEVLGIANIGTLTTNWLKSFTTNAMAEVRLTLNLLVEGMHVPDNKTILLCNFVSRSRHEHGARKGPVLVK